MLLCQDAVPVYVIDQLLLSRRSWPRALPGQRGRNCPALPPPPCDTHSISVLPSGKRTGDATHIPPTLRIHTDMPCARARSRAGALTSSHGAHPITPVRPPWPICVHLRAQALRASTITNGRAHITLRCTSNHTHMREHSACALYACGRMRACIHVLTCSAPLQTPTLAATTPRHMQACSVVSLVARGSEPAAVRRVQYR